jgi:uncharacterized membrane protein
MRWNRAFSVRSYLKSSLWVIPMFALLLEQILNRLANFASDWLRQAGLVDEAFNLLGLSLAGADTLLTTVITLNVSFIVFTFGSLLVAIQVASGQYTPRIIATTLLRDNAIRLSVGFFVFTLISSVRIQNRLDTSFHHFDTFLSAALGLASLVIFLYLIDYAARMLRPVSIVQRVARDGLAVIHEVYPQPTGGEMQPPVRRIPADRQRIVAHAGGSGIVLAVNLADLVAQARQSDGVIEFMPQVGDFVAVGEPLFLLHGGAVALGDQALRDAVAFGPERTIEQDPTFAFRILVDIASKALSPAINDPTTATHAIDQLHRLLLSVGGRHLRSEDICGEDGQLRVILRTPNWEDFVHLSCTEIRHFGAGSIQVVRRLRAMIEVLRSSLPEHRHAALDKELDLLERAVGQHFSFAEDLALARIPDAQGLGSGALVRTGGTGG